MKKQTHCMKNIKSTHKMLFHDYWFKLENDGSLTFDPILDIKSIEAKEGDVFELQIHNSHIVFVKIKKPYAVVPFPPGPG